MIFDDDFGGNHPAIVLSNKLVQEIEGYFVCVMMTSSKYNEFSFVIEDHMLTKPLNTKHCEARCHLINFVPLDAIIVNTHNNQIKIEPFKKLIAKINSTTFSIDEL